MGPLPWDEDHESGEIHANAFVEVHISSVIFEPGKHHYPLDQGMTACGGETVPSSCWGPQKQERGDHSHKVGIAFDHFDDKRTLEIHLPDGNGNPHYAGTFGTHLSAGNGNPHAAGWCLER